MKQVIALYGSSKSNRIDMNNVDLSDHESIWRYLGQASGIKCDTLPSLDGLGRGGVA